MSTRAACKVYDLVAAFDGCDAATLIASSGLSRGAVYLAVKRLLDAGLILQSHRRGCRQTYYVVGQPVAECAARAVRESHDTSSLVRVALLLQRNKREQVKCAD